MASEKLPFGFRQDREPEHEEEPQIKQEISVTACSTSMSWQRHVQSPVNPRA